MNQHQFSEETSPKKEEGVESTKNLTSSLKKLSAEKFLQKESKNKGLTQQFRRRLEKYREDKTIKNSQKAMESLSKEYVEEMIAFKESKEPKMAMRTLNQAEMLWKKHATVIQKNGQQEDFFLYSIRQNAMQILEQKLMKAAESSAIDPVPQNSTLCLTILSVMDSILSESGEDITSPQRQKIREIGRKFMG